MAFQGQVTVKSMPRYLIEFTYSAGEQVQDRVIAVQKKKVEFHHCAFKGFLTQTNFVLSEFTATQFAGYHSIVPPLPLHGVTSNSGGGGYFPSKSLTVGDRGKKLRHAAFSQVFTRFLLLSCVFSDCMFWRLARLQP